MEWGWQNTTNGRPDYDYPLHRRRRARPKSERGSDSDLARVRSGVSIHRSSEIPRFASIPCHARPARRRARGSDSTTRPSATMPFLLIGVADDADREGIKGQEPGDAA